MTERDWDQTIDQAVVRGQEEEQRRAEGESGMGDLLGGVFDLGEVVVDLTSAAGEAVVDLTSAAGEAVAEAASAAGEVAGEVVSAVGEAAGEVVSAVFEALGSL